MNTMDEKGFFSKKIAIGLCLFASLLAAGAGWYYTRSTTGIFDYAAVCDKAAVLDIFKDNLSWLITSPDYSVEYMLDTKSSNKEAKNFGNLTLKVFREDCKTAGFLAYHKKKFYEGFILFVAVDAKYRGKGYAHKLVQEAVKNLKADGCTVVELVTRVLNKPARKVYEGEGFKEIWTDGTFIRYQLKV